MPALASWPSIRTFSVRAEANTPGTRLPFRSAIVLTGESFFTKIATRNGSITLTMRTFGWALPL